MRYKRWHYENRNAHAGFEAAAHMATAESVNTERVDNAAGRARPEDRKGSGPILLLKTLIGMVSMVFTDRPRLECVIKQLMSAKSPPT